MKYVLIVAILVGLGFWIYKCVKDIIKSIKERRAKKENKEETDKKVESDKN